MTETEMREIVIDGTSYRTTMPPKYIRQEPYARPDPTRLTSRLPGTIVEVLVEPGEQIERGRCIAVLEAMKMRNTITANAAGTVKAIHVEPGNLVAKGDLLIELC
jgi:biotin carboxyl carrier protein